MFYRVIRFFNAIDTLILIYHSTA